jgi:drug/metabolite transporter (DMT)-like permease
MALDVGVLVLVLCAAALHASWNALVKAGGDPLVMTTLVMVGPTPVCFAGLLLLPALQPAAWPFLIASSLIHYAYYALLIGAYTHGDLSQVYPISRGAAPALVAVAAWIIAGEALSTAEIVGVLVVSAGIMSLAWRRGVRAPTESKAIGFALLNGVAIASYLIADGMGVRRGGEPLTYICWLFVLEAVPLLAFTLWRRRGRIAAAVAPCLKTGLFGGFIAGISYGITIWAMSLVPMAHIVALRETSVLIGAALGTLVLKEPFGRHRIAAATAVATGAVLLNSGL